MINFSFSAHQGSAMDALSSMQTFLQGNLKSFLFISFQENFEWYQFFIKGRPKSFNSIEQAIEYRF